MVTNRLANARAKARDSDKGFTLIELLIVIVVLGVLAGIVVFGVGTFRGDSALAACKANLKTVSNATDAYVAGTGNNPADVLALVNAKYIKSAPAATYLITTTGGVASSTYPSCTL